MKKKIVILGILIAFAMGVLVACGVNNNNDNGSNTDSGNEVNDRATGGIIDQVVTDAADGIKEAATEVKDGLENAATDAKDALKEGATDAKDAVTNAVDDIMNN